MTSELSWAAIWLACALVSWGLWALQFKEITVGDIIFLLIIGPGALPGLLFMFIVDKAMSLPRSKVLWRKE